MLKLGRVAFATTKNKSIIDSNIIVDLYAYTETGNFNRVRNYFRNMNALFDMKNHIKDFNKPSFNQSLIKNYNTVYELYESRKHQHMYDYVNEELFNVLFSMYKGFQEGC